MNVIIFWGVGLMFLGVLTLMIKMLMRWSYEDGFREGYKQASYDAALIQTQINHR